MSWKVHETDEVFAALRGLCSNSYRMYDPCEHRYYYDHECDAYECAVEDAAQEYERLLRHCEKQREELAAIKNPLGRLKEEFMGSITDELRECIATAVWQYENDVKTAYIPKDKLTAIADRIDERHERGMADAELGASPTEAQMAELGWVKLPVDADGVPIHIGDLMEADGDVFNVLSMELFFDGSWSIRNDVGNGFEYWELHHVKPDSWERIIADAVKNGIYDHDNERIQQKLVERCRRLAHDGR